MEPQTAITVLAGALQITSQAASGWERVGLIGFLVTAIVLLVTSFVAGERVFFGVVPAYRYSAKEEECNGKDAIIEKKDAEIRRLWEEKVEDARKAALVAEAFVEIKRREG